MSKTGSTALLSRVVTAARVLSRAEADAARSRRARRRGVQLLAGLFVASLLAGCSVGSGDLGDSRKPRPDEATIEPDCTREGDFVVEIGEGEESFAPILEGAEPELHHGAQGGTHFILAARLDTPDPLDRYVVDLLAEAGNEPCDGGDCASYQQIGRIAAVVQGSSRIHDIGAGEVEIVNLFLVVAGWDPLRVRRLTLDISDACDRATSTARTFDQAP